MKRLILMAIILVLMSGCATFDNSGKHCPIYLNKSIPLDDRMAYFMMDGEASPWPFCYWSGVKYLHSDQLKELLLKYEK